MYFIFCILVTALPSASDVINCSQSEPAAALLLVRKSASAKKFVRKCFNPVQTERPSPRNQTAGHSAIRRSPTVHNLLGCPIDFKYEQDWTILRYLTISLKNLKNEQFSDAKKIFDTMRSERKINCNLKFRLFLILENSKT